VSVTNNDSSVIAGYYIQAVHKQFPFIQFSFNTLHI